MFRTPYPNLLKSKAYLFYQENKVRPQSEGAELFLLGIQLLPVRPSCLMLK